MENDFQKVTCPICRATSTSFFLKKNSFNLWRCSECEHVFIYPFAFDTAVIYDDDYFAGGENGAGYVNYDADKEPMRPVFVDYLKRIEAMVPLRGRLLDVGAATGFFIQIAKDRGWNVQGVEISDYAAAKARAKGLDVKAVILTGANYDAGMFDVVTMWDVLEHFPNPKEELEETHRLLKSGGVLAINTPDSGSWYARLMGRRWHLLVPPEHINYFTTASVRRVLADCGFELITLTQIGKTFTLEYIIHIMGTWFKSPKMLRLAHGLERWPWLGKISLPINLRDNMFILARKK